MKKALILVNILFQFLYSSDYFYFQENKKLNLFPYDKSLRSNPNIDYYQNEKGIILGVTDKIIAKLKSGVTIDNLLSKYNISLVSSLGNNLYLLKTSDKSVTIAISNQLNEDEDTEYAQPDFVKKRFSR